jgi:integrase
MAEFKIRGKKPDEPQVVDEKQIAKFINAADKTPEELDELDKDAKRDYNQLGLRVNRYENDRIEAMAKKLGRKPADVLRYAVFKLADEILED